MCRDLTGIHISLSQQANDFSPGFIGQRLKDQVVPHATSLFSHLPKY
jgi:hypothetical protein